MVIRRLTRAITLGVVVAAGFLGPAAQAVSATRLSAEASRTVRYLQFQTGTDSGQRYPAIICTIAPLGEQELYCWTPNDGYTISMLGYPIGSGQVLPNSARPRRRRSDELRNRHRLLRHAHYLPSGFVERYGSFTCVSRASGLNCRNEEGHGWSLPRYVGLPRTF
jgi:hypothetical protein